jgi:predicted AAA+ superfamily ATPase
MIKRKYFSKLEELGAYFPAIGILGPRRVGKTTLVKQFIDTLSEPHIYLDLEKPSDYEKLNEAELYFSQHSDKCLVLDEIQIRPELFAIIRAAIDENKKPLRFILLGSASPDLIRNSAESLAGRISYLHIQPFSLVELANENPTKHHFRGGFPESYLAPEDKLSIAWLEAFIKTYIERDLPLLGLPASPILTRRFWEMLAWQNGQLFNASNIGKSLGVSYHTVKTYLDFIEGAFMVKTIHPFVANIKKRLVKSPKIYISDTGLLHRLLRINDYDQLLGMPNLGASYEAYVLQQILAEKPGDLDVYFYRTHNGTEVDFVLARANQAVATIEVKFTSSPSASKSLKQGIADLKTANNYIVVPKSESFQKSAQIKVSSLFDFLTNELPAL